MGAKKSRTGLFWIAFLCSWASATALLSPKGVNFEVQALMGIKASLKDPHGVLQNRDHDSVDPCSWTMVTCSPKNLVIGLGTPSQNLSGTLSPSIGNLTNLEIVLLQNNNITGPIPLEIGSLRNLHTLDLSNNYFTGDVPTSLGHLESLEYLDLSYNNLSGPMPRFPARTFNIVGNPLICATGSEQECYETMPMPISFNLNDSQSVAMEGVKFSSKIGNNNYRRLRDIGNIVGPPPYPSAAGKSKFSMDKKTHKESLAGDDQ